MKMTKYSIVATACLCVLGCVFTHAENHAEGDSSKRFAELLEFPWKPVFFDPCTGDWKNEWTLDGKKATIQNGPKGMDFSAGRDPTDEAHHAVLWTRKDFEGDLKIEYEYTRLDDEHRKVTIIYVQATGSGKPGFDKDIAAWADKRVVPSMKSYFNNMNAYHISYAAFENQNDDPCNDYIRARRYVCGDLNGTELDNEYEKTGLFETGVPHKITIIKHGREIYMRIKNDSKEFLCHFVNSRFDPVTEGKIGLRHMNTRSARYKDFRVSVLLDKKPEPAIRNDAQSSP
jgi:hypothetical protein